MAKCFDPHSDKLFVFRAVLEEPYNIVTHLQCCTLNIVHMKEVKEYFKDTLHFDTTFSLLQSTTNVKT